MRSRVCFIIAFIIFASASANAQEPRWHDGIFIEGAVQYYFAPEIFAEMIEPEPGIRGAIGYEFYHIRLAVEGGYTHIKGTNPIVLDFDFYPLVFKAGYALPIWKGFGVQADLSAGFLYSTTTHYHSAIDMILEKDKISNERSFLAGARLYAFYEFPQDRYPQNLVKVYAGGGVDAVNEHEGMILMPLIEAGISLKPFTLIRKREPKQAPPQEVPLKELPIITHDPEEYTAEDSKQGRTVRLVNGVYFEKNSVLMLAQYLPKLDEAAKLLAENPDLHLTLRAYSAPEYTAEWQPRHGDETPALSAARIRFCANYIIQKSGIAPERAHERIKFDHIHSDQLPHFAGANLDAYRCVELVIE